MTASAKVATILSLIPASSDIEKTVGAVYESVVLNKVQAHKIYRVQSPHPPLHPASVSSPRNKGGGVHTRRAVRVGEGFNILEDAKHRIGLLKYNLSAGTSSVKDNVSSLGETFQKI